MRTFRTARDFYAIGGTWRALARLHMTQTNYPLSVMHNYRINAEDALNKISGLYEQGQDDEAMAEIRKLLIIEPTNAKAFLLSGKINQRRGDQEAAIAALKTAIFWEPPPKMIEAHILLGRIFLERGDLGEARKYAASATNIDPNNQEAIALQRQVTMGRP